MIGRERELELLEERYSSDSYEMIPIYGRRRVGKTTLLKEFSKGKNGVYFTATKGSLKSNLSKLASKVLGTDSPIYMGLEDILKEVSKKSLDERYLLIIDEYPNLVKRNPEVNDILQEFLDDMQDSKLFLILCGSSMSIMKHEILGYNSPIYGRRTGSLEILPLSVWDSMKILDGFDREDAMRIFGMVGGIPLYLNMFKSTSTLEDNVYRLFLQESSFFRNEHEFVLMEEFDNPLTYYTVIEAAAMGKNKLSEIAAYCGLDESTVHKYLGNLQTTGFIERIAPVDNPEGKNVRYKVSDPFMNFQFKRILPEFDYIDHSDPMPTIERILKLFDTDMGAVFEKVCAEHLYRIHRGNIGKWWGSDPRTKRQEEIDLISTSRRDDVMAGWFAECKYRNEPVGTDVLQTLIHRTSLVKGYDECRYVLYSKSGFTAELQDRDVELFDLNSVLNFKGM